MAQRVLVVDDSATIRKIVGSALTKAGYEVAFAADGLQAFGVLKREQVHLALVDFVMPKINGFELCRKIREDQALRDLPVVLMSAKADRIREHFLRQTGALDAITKPFDPRALLLAIEGALRKAEDGRVRRESNRPESFGEGSSEPSNSDPFIGAPTTVRPTVPDSFVRKLAEVMVRLPREVREERDPARIVSMVRKQVGADGLSSLYIELVGAPAWAVLTGDIGAIPLAEVLQLLQLQRQTGVLSVFQAQVEIQIVLRDGLVDIATSRGAADEFRLGRYLVEGGKLDRKRLDTLLEKERRSSRPRLLGDALVAEGLLNREDIDRALTRQTSELIYDVLRWTRGRFVFDQRGLPPTSAAQLALPVASIVMEGFRRVDEWRLMEGALGDFEQTFYRDPGAIEAMGASRLSPQERIVLAAVDGERTVREIIGALSMGSFDVCKILYQLVQSRLIRRRVS